MYQISGFYNVAEEDDFEQGCIGPGEPDTYYDYSIKDETLTGLLKKIAEHHGCPVAELDIDVCDELGRVEFSRQEGEDGDELPTNRVADWKAGKVKAYYATYTCYMMHCVAVSANERGRNESTVDVS